MEKYTIWATWLLSAQVIFGRRTRTHLPMTAKMLQSTSGKDDVAKGALMKAKLRQKDYYDAHSRMRPQIPPGSTMRTRWNKNEDWKKARVVEVLPHRSFKVQFADGTIRRRTSKHVRFTNEPPGTDRCPTKWWLWSGSNRSAWDARRESSRHWRACHHWYCCSKASQRTACTYIDEVIEQCTEPSECALYSTLWKTRQQTWSI